MGPIIKEPKPEDPSLDPPPELLPILDILNHALLEPFGICQNTDDVQLLISRLRRARSWRLSLDPAHPVIGLVFRHSLESPNQVWITRESLIEAEELSRVKALNESGEAE